MVGRDVDGFGGFDSAIDIRLGYFAVFNFYDALRIEAADMITGYAGGDTVDLAISHPFGFVHGLANGLGGGIDIGHHTGTQAA